MTDPVDLTILMPCLNEAETLGTCVRKALRSLAEANISGEVIVADNGSTDGCQEIATRLGARVVTVSTKGYGNAFMGTLVGYLSLIDAGMTGAIISRRTFVTPIVSLWTSVLLLTPA